MAIRTAADKILAEVEFITAEKTGDYGPYCSVLFRRYDLEGDEAKLWRSLPPDQARQFTKKQQVYLIPVVRKGKQTWDIELIDNGPTPPAAGPTRPAESPAKYHALQLSKDQKFAIAAYLENRADLIAYCFQVANQKLAALDPDSQRAAAIELYRSAINKFNL